jgi:hypothetical protein
LATKFHYSIKGNVTLDRESHLRNIAWHAITATLVEIELSLGWKINSNPKEEIVVLFGRKMCWWL